MRLFVIPVLLVSVLSLPAFGAVDPALLDLTPPGTKVLMGVNVEQAAQSSFGQFALGKLPQDQGMMQFVTATGFDFRRDLHEILVANDGSHTPGQQYSLISIRGRFQPAKISALAALSGATSAPYGGLNIFTVPSSPQPTSGVFLDADTLVLGSGDAVKAVIDQRASGKRYTGPLAKQAEAASTQYDVWVTTTSPFDSSSALGLGGLPGGMSPAIFSSILAASAGVRFDSNGANVSGEAIAASSQDAQSIAGVAQLILALAQASKAQGAQPGAELLRNASVAADGSTIRIKLSIPEKQLEQMFTTPNETKKVSLPAR